MASVSHLASSYRASHASSAAVSPPFRRPPCEPPVHANAIAITSTVIERVVTSARRIIRRPLSPSEPTVPRWRRRGSHQEPYRLLRLPRHMGARDAAVASRIRVDPPSERLCAASHTEGASTIARATARSSNAIPTLLKTVRSSGDRRTGAPRTVSARSAATSPAANAPSAMGIASSPASASATSRRLDHDPPATDRLGVQLPGIRAMGADRVHVDAGPQQGPVEHRVLRRRAGADQVGIGDGIGIPHPSGEAAAEAVLHERLRRRQRPRDDDELRHRSHGAHRLEMGSRLDARAEEHEPGRVRTREMSRRQAGDGAGPQRGEGGPVEDGLGRLRVGVEQHVARLDVRDPAPGVRRRERDQLHADPGRAERRHQEQRAARCLHGRSERSGAGVERPEGGLERVDRRGHREASAQLLRPDQPRLRAHPDMPRASAGSPGGSRPYRRARPVRSGSRTRGRRSTAPCSRSAPR